MSVIVKALIIVDHGSKVKEANNVISDIANLIRNMDNSGFDIVTHSHMELAEPTINQAFDHCVKCGADEIIIHPYFLVPGRHSVSDIPKLVREASRRHLGVKYHITDPLGLHDKIIEVVLERCKCI